MTVPRVVTALTLGFVAAACTSPSKSQVGASPQASVADRDPPEARAARERLIARIGERHSHVSRRVLDAMRAVPRHLFVSASVRDAYADRPLPIGHGQTISQPTVVALMTSALDLSGTERVLEIGTGSGYQAAVLSPLVKQVYTIEIVRPLGETAATRLAELGYHNVQTRIGDGYLGWPDAAPFDRVLLTAAPHDIPQALVDQLRVGGILVGPVGEGYDQRLVRWTKTATGLVKEDLGAVVFVPMVGG